MTDKKPRNRSPEHPAFDLAKAIDRGRVLYEAEHFNFANTATVLGHWGYGPKSSSGLRTLAALIHFGLLDEEGSKTNRKVRLSRLAKEILLRDEGTPERERAIREAALKPRIYDELQAEVEGPGVLPSDRELRYKLEMEWGFNPNAIDRFISDFKSTMEFANLLRDGLDSDAQYDSKADTSSHKTRREVSPHLQRERPMPSGQREQQVLDLTIPLIGGGLAVLSTPVPLSEENFGMLETFLQTFRRSLTEREESEPEEPSRSSDIP